MTSLSDLYKQLSKTQKELDRINRAISAEQTELRRSVQFNKTGETITLSTPKGRQYKVTKNTRGRWKIVLNGRVVNGDYLGSMNDLRLELASK